MNSRSETLLGEGTTPLVPSMAIGPALDGKGLHFKLETLNPSGSYKDRFAAQVVAGMRQAQVAACVATSSGNTGSALAAYCARARIRCFIVVNEAAPAAKLLQMRAHGAQVIVVPRFVVSSSVTRRVLEQLRQLSERQGMPLIVSAFRYCPEGMAAVEAIGREILLQSSEPPDHIFVPVGGGGLFSAICRGVREYPRVRVHAVQQQGCLTLVASYLRGDDAIAAVESTTRVSGLSVPWDIDASYALQLLKTNGGWGIAVSDEDSFSAQARLLLEEGISCEPAGAAALAGFLQARRDGRVGAGERCVCLVTGHGFKDADSIETIASTAPVVELAVEGLGAALAQRAGLRTMHSS